MEETSWEGIRQRKDIGREGMRRDGRIEDRSDGGIREKE